MTLKGPKERIQHMTRCNKYILFLLEIKNCENDVHLSGCLLSEGPKDTQLHKAGVK